MPTGDGLLVRLHPPGGRLSSEQVRAVAETARRCGNGLVDVSARGNLQIRGLQDETHAPLVARLRRAGLVEAVREGPLRLTIVSPLAGLDPADRIDADRLARAVEAEASGLEGLPPKLCVSIDGGGRLPLQDLDADIRLVALEQAGPPALAVGLAGPAGPVWAGVTTPQAAPAVIRAMLCQIPAMVHDGLPARRVHALSASARARLATSAHLAPPVVPPARAPGPRAGTIEIGDAAAVLLGWPFGRCNATALERLADWSEQYGSGELRLSPWRGVALPGVRPTQAAALIGAARHEGFIVEPDDPRLSVAACPGQPACRTATTPTHRDAALLARAAGSLLARGLHVHVSGCQKGCAHPAPADLTLVGQDGAYAVVIGGTPRESSPVRLTIDAVASRLATVETAAGLASAFPEIMSRDEP